MYQLPQGTFGVSLSYVTMFNWQGPTWKHGSSLQAMMAQHLSSQILDFHIPTSIQSTITRAVGVQMTWNLVCWIPNLRAHHFLVGPKVKFHGRNFIIQETWQLLPDSDRMDIEGLTLIIPAVSPSPFTPRDWNLPLQGYCSICTCTELVTTFSTLGVSYFNETHVAFWNLCVPHTFRKLDWVLYWIPNSRNQTLTGCRVWEPFKLKGDEQ